MNLHREKSRKKGPELVEKLSNSHTFTENIFIIIYFIEKLKFKNNAMYYI